ncbi:S-adenosyl-L-methionine-dependent methyltransferase [Xylaria sp. CBS 124048]|nr:S-adenosyl-L-methionine-dependent methyltransferase [Xylaria sp. CBS 124048]
MTSDAVDINRSVFNEEAANYDDKHRKLINRLTRELQARLDFIGVDWASDDEEEDEHGDEDGDGDSDKDSNDEGDEKESEPPRKREVRLLDYACGTGVISRVFAPYTTQCVGMDISEKMVEEYNARSENQGLSPAEMHAIVGDLASDTISHHLMAPHLFDFDLAVVGGGLHHFANPDRAVKRLVERLKPGGVLLVWDFMPHGPQPHRHDHHAGGGQETASGLDIFSSVLHHGFSEERMRDMFTAAGAGAHFQLELIWGGWATGHGDESNADGEEKKNGREDGSRRQVFFARGTKGN